MILLNFATQTTACLLLIGLPGSHWKVSWCKLWQLQEFLAKSLPCIHASLLLLSFTRSNKEMDKEIHQGSEEA
jgi:hypothetical protein